MSFNQPPSLTQAINALARRVGILERRPFPRSRFQDLADADLSKVADGQVPMYDQASGMYIPGNAGGCTDVFGAQDVAGELPVTREVVLTETKTLMVTINAWSNNEENGGHGAIGAWINNVWPSGASGRAVGVSDGEGGFTWTGSLVYVVTLGEGTYQVGGSWTSSDITAIFMSVGIVVGCDTGDQTVFGGA